MDVDDYTRPLESVIRDERKARPLPLRVQDHRELFDEWCALNPQALREIELTALAISAHGKRVSTKYLIEKQRYEGRSKLNPVTFYDLSGHEHTYGINNTITPMLARYLLDRHPDMDIVIKHSIFDEKENSHEA